MGRLLIIILIIGSSGCASNETAEAEGGHEGSVCVGVCWVYEFIVSGRGSMDSTVGEDDTAGGVGDHLLREQDGAGTERDTGL